MTTRALLAIETSTTEARVGVFDVDTGARLAGASATSERHSSNLLRLCVETAEQAGITLASLSAIACGAGPGSFTGLRVGYAVAKGLAMPFELPFFSVSSLQALAWDMAPFARAGERLVPCLDAGKGQVYVAVFAGAPDGGGGGSAGGGCLPEGRAVTRLSDDWVVAPAALPAALAVEPPQPLILTGNGAARHREVWQTAFAVAGGGGARFVEVAGPSADAVAAHAIPRYRRGEREDLGSAVPAYGRAPDITRPKSAATKPASGGGTE
jgi:tRNA threonylcarbamoyl adenosine modification protein YeaZ